MREHEEDSIRMLHELVATPSVSGSEADAVAVFVRHAQRLGYEASTDDAGNGIALRGATGNETHRIVLLGHIDTVPGDLKVEIVNGALRGRGSVDAKGPLTAFLRAASATTLPEGIAVEVIAAVGEETADSPGATFIRDRRTPAACIIGEPSGWDGVTIGYKGRLLVGATCRKDWSHTAGAESSAADTLHAWWGGVLSALEQHESSSAPRLFDQIQSTIQTCHSGNDGLTERAEMTAGFRLPASLDPSALEALIRSLTPGSVELSFKGHTPAHTSGRSNAVACALSSAIRTVGGSPRPKLKTGTADFNVVGPAWGCPIAAYGPGDSALDHTPHERIELDEYLRSIEVLTIAIESLAEGLVEREHVETISA